MKRGSILLCHHCCQPTRQDSTCGTLKPINLIHHVVAPIVEQVLLSQLGYVAVILGFGTDLISVSRIAQVYERHPERFLQRTYHPTEQAY